MIAIYLDKAPYRKGKNLFKTSDEKCIFLFCKILFIYCELKKCVKYSYV